MNSGLGEDALGFMVLHLAAQVAILSDGDKEEIIIDSAIKAVNAAIDRDADGAIDKVMHLLHIGHGRILEDSEPIHLARARFEKLVD